MPQLIKIKFKIKFGALNGISEPVERVEMMGRHGQLCGKMLQTI